MNNDKILNIIYELVKCQNNVSESDNENQSIFYYHLCELSLFFLDLQRNYANYIYNRDIEFDNYNSGIYLLKKHRLSRTFNKIENFVYLCYMYFSAKSDNYNDFNISQDIFKEDKVRLINFLSDDIIINDINQLYSQCNFIQISNNIDEKLSAICLFLCSHFPNHENIKKMNKNIDEVIKKSEGKDGCGKLRKKFRKDTFCSC